MGEGAADAFAEAAAGAGDESEFACDAEVHEGGVKGDDGLVHYFAHLSAANVVIGQQVSAGEVIALSGNSGGSPEKPVGTIWIAVGNKNKTATHQLNLRFDRERNITMTGMFALNMLRKFILEN